MSAGDQDPLSPYAEIDISPTDFGVLLSKLSVQESLARRYRGKFRMPRILIPVTLIDPATGQPNLGSFDGTNFKRSFVSGTGTIKTISITQPGAGAEFTQTVPAGKVWRINSLVFTLAASGVAGNRQTIIRITDGTNRLYEYGMASSAPITSGQTKKVFGEPLPALTSGATSSDTTQAYSLPEIALGPGYVLTSFTYNIDTGDQYSGIFLKVEEFIL